MDTSIEMARVALQGGIETIVATPHINLRYGLEGEDIAERVAALRAALAEERVPITVLPGAEIALTRLAGLDDSQLRALCIGQSSCALIESPYTTAGEVIEEAIFELQVRGFRPLLAHPERCPEFQQDSGRLTRLVERGVTCSVNAGSLVGQFGRTAKRTASRLLDEQLLHNLSSDGHDPVQRAPALGVAFDGDDRLSDAHPLQRWLTTAVPAAILADAPLPPRPPAEASRSQRHWRLRR